MNNRGIFSTITTTLESMCAQRLPNERAVARPPAEPELALKERVSELACANQRLLEEVARHQDNLRLLRQSEVQYRCIFAESPHPQWILDLRSQQLLEVNNAALALFGFAREEFLALPASRLLSPDAIPFFHRDLAIPCPKIQSRGHWPLCRKDGTRIQVEIKAMDLNYDGRPARLNVPIAVAESRQPEPEQPRVGKIDMTSTNAASQSSDGSVRVVDTQSNLLVPKFPESACISRSQTTTPAATPSSPRIRRQALSPEPRSTKIEPPKRVVPAPNVTTASPDPTGKPSLLTPEAPVMPRPLSARLPAPQKKTILLVEPEGKVRSLARFLLTRQGYRVIETDCCSTVLALWESEGINVDVLLTDVTLPEGTSGRALADQLRQTRPELKVVYTSTAAGPDGETPSADQEIIPKPYTSDTLLRAIQGCLMSATPAQLEA